MADSAQGARYNRRILAPIVLALTIRVAVIPFLISDTLNPARDHWKFGSEEGRIARSIAAGEGFSSPLFGRTGPTAWTTPVYPYLLAGVFRLFGTYTREAAWAILTLNALFSALTCIPVYFIAERSFGQTAARWAAWTWALHPYVIYFSAEYVWGYCLDALMLSLVLWCTIEIEEETSLRWWIAYGFLWGLAALTNPVILSTLPFLLGWLAWRRHWSGIRWPFSMAGAVLMLVLTVTPWFVRNYVTFGRFVPFRGTFWMIFWEGNTGDMSELYPDWADPSTNDAEMEKYRRFGERGYMKEKRLASLDFLEHQPRLFASLTFKRFVFTWTGFWSLRSDYVAAEPFAIPNIVFCSLITVLALAGLHRAYQIKPQATTASALVLLSYPLIYYITSIGTLGSALAMRRTEQKALFHPE